MWRNAKTVALREFWVTVRRPGYLIGTFGMPVFLALYIGVVMIPQMMVQKKEAARRVAGLVDESGLVDTANLGEASKLPPEAEQAAKALGVKTGDSEKMEESAKVKVMPFESREKAQKALESKEIFSYFVVPADYLQSGKVLTISGGSNIFDKGRWKYSYMSKLLLSGLLKGKLDETLIDRVKNPVELVEITRDQKGERETTWQEELSKFGIPFGFAIFLMLSIMMGAGFLLQGVAEEKENRIIEVILSSVTAQDFFTGKLLGLGVAAFIQLAVWLLLVVVPLGIFLKTFGITIPFSLIVVALLYFVAGFFMMASLILGSGALGTNLKEAQQLSMVWSMTMVPGIYFIMVIVDEPAGVTARVLSYIPFTAPTIMVARHALGGAPWWEHILALSVLAFSTWLAIKFSSKLFRIGLLLYGKRPTMKEIWRYLREA